jgi:hypothetical protein
MSIETKKKEIAGKMYKQNSTGGLGKAPKNYMHGKEKGNLEMKYKMNGEGTGTSRGEKFEQSNKKGKFEDKYEQADKSGLIKGGYKMNC